MTTQHPVELRCPNCRNQFTSSTLISFTRTGTDTDFRPRTAGADILEFLIHTCPKCGFSGQEDHFSGKVSREVAQLIDERLTPLVRDERSTASRRYEYAAWIAEWRRQGDGAVAEYYLRAAWCSRDSYGQTLDDQESYYRSKAIEHYENVLDNGAGGDEATALTYLVGELHRRNGVFDEAQAWFAKAVALAGHDADQKWAADLATRQAELATQGIAGDSKG